MSKQRAAAYDLAVIGGGSAGLTAAGFAAQLGRKVAIIERNRIGGDCTWTGCVPSKVLLRVARTAHETRQAHRFGITSAEPEVDLSSVMAHVRSVIEQIYQAESPEALQTRGIDTCLAPVKFTDSHTLSAGDTTIKAKRILIATGARPFIPPIPGLDGVEYLTYETVWELEKLPRRLLVVGGGPIGCELAQAFQRLGSHVALVEAAERILLHDEPEAADLLAQVLTGEGIDFRLGAPVESVWQDATGIHLTAGGQEVAGDSLLLAVGRRPNVNDMDLERAGVSYNSGGIAVNAHLRTSQRHIYAAGDCTGGFQFTHYAGWQGFMAARNALLPGNARAVLDLAPWATFTDPEIAHAGLTEAQARQRYGNRIEVATWPMDKVDRAITEGDEIGAIKVVCRPNGKLLGATMVNARAGEMIHQWILAIDQGLKLGDLADSLHIYPTYSMAGMQLATEGRVSRLLAGTLGKIVRSLSRSGG